VPRGHHPAALCRRRLPAEEFFDRACDRSHEFERGGADDAASGFDRAVDPERDEADGEGDEGVEQGVAEPADIDLAIKAGMGYAMGPMELLDLVGMDTQKLLCEAMAGVTHEPRANCPPLVRRMIAAGHLGKKSGRGFHTYADSKMYGA